MRAWNDLELVIQDKNMLKKLRSVHKPKLHLKTPSVRNCNIATVKWCDCLRSDVSGDVLVSSWKSLVYPELCVQNGSGPIKTVYSRFQ